MGRCASVCVLMFVFVCVCVGCGCVCVCVCARMCTNMSECINLQMQKHSDI